MRHKLVGAMMAGMVASLGTAPIQADDAVRLLDAAVEQRTAGANLEALMLVYDALAEIWADIPLTLDYVELVAEPPRGYAAFVPRADAVFAPGEPIRVYLEPIGYGFRPTGPDALEVHLSADYLLLNADGQVLAGQRGFGEFVFALDQPAYELYVSLDFRFTGAPDGDYLLQAELVDRVSGDRAPFDIPFTIRGN